MPWAHEHTGGEASSWTRKIVCVCASSSVAGTQPFTHSKRDFFWMTEIWNGTETHSPTEQRGKPLHSSQSDHIASGLNQKREAKGEGGPNSNGPQNKTLWCVCARECVSVCVCARTSCPSHWQVHIIGSSSLPSKKEEGGGTDSGSQLSVAQLPAVCLGVCSLLCLSTCVCLRAHHVCHRAASLPY